MNKYKKLTIALGLISLGSLVNAVDIQQVKQQGHKLNKVEVINYSNGDLLTKYKYAFIDENKQMWVVAEIINKTTSIKIYKLENQLLTIEPNSKKEVLLDKSSYVSIILQNKTEIKKHQKTNFDSKNNSTVKEIKNKLIPVDLKKKQLANKLLKKDKEQIKVKTEVEKKNKEKQTTNKISCDSIVSPLKSTNVKLQTKIVNLNNELNLKFIESNKLNKQIVLLKSELSKEKNSSISELSKLNDLLAKNDLKHSKKIKEITSNNLKTSKEAANKYQELIAKNSKIQQELEKRHAQVISDLKKEIYNLESTVSKQTSSESYQVILKNIREIINNLNNIDKNNTIDKSFMSQELEDMYKIIIDTSMNNQRNGN